METNRNVVASLKTGLICAAVIAGIVACGGGSRLASIVPPSTATKFTTTSLVSDGEVDAANNDDNLVNAWGIAFDPTGFAWVANNRSGTVTSYDGGGVPQPTVVTIPTGAVGAGGPTGIVFNGTQDFKVTQNGVTGASTFIIATLGGTIAAWSPAVDNANAVTMFDGGPGGPSYTGLTLANYAGANYLYAANFLNKTIDVFDANFRKVSVPGGFSDPSLPAGYAPFGIQAIGDRIYVTFAQQGAIVPLPAKGLQLGVVDVFDTGGVLIKQLVVGGVLNAPWGIALAPANFGDFSNALLVGNLGDGKIHAFELNTGNLIGALRNPDGTPIEIDELWGISFGNGVNSQPTNTLFFAAGPMNTNHGQYGRLDMH